MGAPVKKPEEPRPGVLYYLFELYYEMKFTRVVKDEGKVSIRPRDVLTSTEIKDYLWLTQTTLKPWEVKVLFQLDGVFESG